ncbi:MAG: ATP synthase F0 subunit B [Desulfobacterales bacterium]|uniref:ATP synthase subunit b n=1 Tax=Candidatus Desulfaltia bathyphila TaxID=2841697 RepID=A0A8J6N5Q0_9BACT|nr:ATP synthase F0 subunit B [Candidatus Desulfaltia bathyphila]MBL7195003.1 ATP synthase F0 subunit B [Desulfobacterales bacterium]MBL7208225.1 ATP synthase F0 subunit B [Desulfobacterales bacterium]
MKLFNKKEPGISRKRNLIAIMTIVVVVLIFSGVAFGSSGGEHGPKGWVATDTYKVMNFTVLIVALFFLLRKPVAQALNARIKGIQDQLDELEVKKKEAEKKLAEYNERLFLLDKEAEKIVAEYIKQGNEAKARILEEAGSEAKKLEEQAKRNIENEFKQAKSKLQEEISEKALLKAEEIIKSKITTEDQDRLIDEYLEKVVA